ncbi:MAG TPA: TadE/TadG family type IV pilus assembly protein [Ilumatobacter sp.]|jgi:Flp pilus assembly protein TadG|nr:TadE/TadG family type IV pilus assembly protein [Ilumatobacter sp.]
MGDRTQRDRGQAAVEFALALPVVLVLVLGIVQLVVVVRDQLAVELAAREAARAASVSASPEASATRAANAATSLRPLAVATDVDGDRVSVSVTYVGATDVPLVGAFIADITVTADVTMRREPP